MGKYDDIINRPHHQSVIRKHMSMHDRAAQFAPFAALKGYEEAVDETARITDKRILLDETEISKIDAKLQLVMENIVSFPEITVTYFVKDDRKAGGTYVTKTGPLKKIDEYQRTLIFIDGTKVPIDDIYDLC